MDSFALSGYQALTNDVQFGVFHRGAVGVYAKPDAIPPPDEVNKKAYHYFECPLEPLPPMPANVFLHYMRCAKHENWSEKHPGAHQENIFLQRLPKKMGASIWQQPTNSMTGSQTISYGWGVQIIEGPNKKIMSLLLILGTLFSFLVSVLFVVLAKSQEQGFGIGQWILAVLTEVSFLPFHVLLAKTRLQDSHQFLFKWRGHGDLRSSEPLIVKGMCGVLRRGRKRWKSFSILSNYRECHYRYVIKHKDMLVVF
ncbi:hypothetical protein F5Y18DRAFT_179453 [Xylariaceae sp. FL1019]|nr:hypothetical protein F5Y18DRAFT_179453 [Xylariaceae sp. FL1019]